MTVYRTHAISVKRELLPVLWVQLRLMILAFFLFYFSRDQNSQHFNEDLLGVNTSAFSFVLCFKAINDTGSSNYVISANGTALENF